jgi:hypothetical protein
VRRLVPAAKAPLALAGLLALPVFFASLMAVSLAIEKPQVVEWSRPGGKIARIYHEPTASLEAKIWLLSFVPALLLVVVGWLASFVPYGIYVASVAAVADVLVLTHRLPRWQAHHSARFPYGEDLLADQTNSSSLLRGQWEQNAADTARSLAHDTLALALIAIATGVLLSLRRRRAPVRGGTAELQQTGGAPTTSGV